MIIIAVVVVGRFDDRVMRSQVQNKPPIIGDGDMIPENAFEQTHEVSDSVIIVLRVETIALSAVGHSICIS